MTTTAETKDLEKVANDLFRLELAVAGTDDLPEVLADWTALCHEYEAGDYVIAIGCKQHMVQVSHAGYESDGGATTYLTKEQYSFILKDKEKTGDGSASGAGEVNLGPIKLKGKLGSNDMTETETIILQHDLYPMLSYNQSGLFTLGTAQEGCPRTIDKLIGLEDCLLHDYLTKQKPLLKLRKTAGANSNTLDLMLFIPRGGLKVSVRYHEDAGKKESVDSMEAIKRKNVLAGILKAKLGESESKTGLEDKLMSGQIHLHSQTLLLTPPKKEETVEKKVRGK